MRFVISRGSGFVGVNLAATLLARGLAAVPNFQWVAMAANSAPGRGDHGRSA
jgi:hypothetical protein